MINISGTPSTVWICGVLAMGVAILPGCQQEMAVQPSLRPLEPYPFFTDGRVARPWIEGTVARGHLRTDAALFTGRRNRQDGGTETNNSPSDKAGSSGTKDSDSEDADFVDAFPLPITAEVLEHGYHRYMVFCVVCHDPLGQGRGKIVERGYTAPPSYHIPRIRRSPPGRFFVVISEGYGSMPSYEAQIPPRDRWTIAAYIRALQLSQHFPVDRLSEEMRREWDQQRRTTPAGGRSP